MVNARLFFKNGRLPLDDYEGEVARLPALADAQVPWKSSDPYFMTLEKPKILRQF